MTIANLEDSVIPGFTKEHITVLITTEVMFKTMVNGTQFLERL